MDALSSLNKFKSTFPCVFHPSSCRVVETRGKKEKKRGKDNDEGCLACLDEARRGEKEKENDEGCFACCLDEDAINQ